MIAPYALLTRALALFALALAALALPAPGALAHERREVGKYELEVGFLNEPAYVGLLNGLSLEVATLKGEEPVQGLDQTLRVEVIKGAATMPLTLEPRFRQPGAYNAYFFPTEPGAYTFHLTGSIEGQAIDERFTSGPTTFSEVEDAGGLQFPTRLPSAAEVQARLAALEQQVAELRARVAAGEAAPSATSVPAALRVENAWARAALAMGGMTGNSGEHGMGATSAIYLTIVNEGQEADRLVAARTDAAAVVELHQTILQDGVMRMQAVEAIEVPAGGRVELKPGGYHIMLIDLRRDLRPGERLPVELRFERGGSLTVEAEVRQS